MNRLVKMQKFLRIRTLRSMADLLLQFPRGLCSRPVALAAGRASGTHPARYLRECNSVHIRFVIVKGAAILPELALAPD